MTKNELRKKYKLLRQQLSSEERDDLSMAIANKTLELPIWDRSFFHLFLPILRHNEINTHYLLHILSGKDKEIIVAKSDFETCEMQHFLLTDNTKLVENEYGIPEPIGGISILPEQIQVVFVPLLAFDLAGNRVGYGKGFYDRFLAKCNSDAIKIGLSFFDAEPSCSDVFESDIRLDYCVTPDKIYKF